MIKWGEVDIVISPAVGVKPTRVREATVDMDILTSQSVNAPKPITLVIKGANFRRVLELLSLHGKTDEELAKVVRDSILADEVKGKTLEETAAWVRKNVLDELTEMSA